MEHFHPHGKPASAVTTALGQAARKALPFDDVRDFQEARKGFIAAPEYRQIMAEAGHVAWDIGSYDFLLDGQDFDSIHPSLQRQAILNMEYGLTRSSPAGSIRCADSTWPTSVSSDPTPDGLSLIR